MNTKTTITALMVLALSNTTIAQEQALEEVKVWGTAVKSDSVFVGEEEIAIKQADHLSDLLRYIPGVEIGGTHSVNARINFRGLDDRDLGVYIDGASQKNYMYHHMGNLLINADILKSADISLGAGSVIHDGLGGSIYFETKDAADLLEGSKNNFGARLMAGYNSNAQVSTSLTAYSQLSEAADAMLYYSNVDRDNFEDGDGVSTIGSDGTTKNLLAKLGFNVSDSQRLELSYESINDKGDYTQRPDMGVRTNQKITGDLLLPTEYERDTINLSYELSLDNTKLRATLYKNEMLLWRDGRKSFTRSGPGTITEADAENTGLHVMATTELDYQTLTYGVELLDQDMQGRLDLSNPARTVAESSKSKALFIQDEIKLSDSFSITPGVRYNDYQQTIANSNSKGSWSETNFGLSANWALTDNLTLLASYTQLFKGPELAEVFIGGANNKIVNPNLEPETGDNKEFGLRYSSQIGDGRFNFGVNLFDQTIDDFIAEQSVQGSEGLVQDANVGQASIDGYEASISYLVNNWDFLLTFASADLDQSKLNLRGNSDSLRQIGDSIGANVSYQWGDVLLSYNANIIKDLNLANGQQKAGYDVHNISARWISPFNVDGLSLTAGVDNLFDELYTSHASRTGEVRHPRFGFLKLDDIEPGRNLKMTLSYKF